MKIWCQACNPYSQSNLPAKDFILVFCSPVLSPVDDNCKQWTFGGKKT